MVGRLKTNKILRKKISRSIIENKKQFLAVIAISFLAVALFCGLTANAKYLKKRVDVLYEKGNIGDVYVTFAGYDENDLTEINKIDEVLDSSIRATLDANYHGNNISVLINEVDNNISIPLIEEGEMGFLLDKNFAKKEGIKIGDEILITYQNTFYLFLKSYPEGQMMLNYMANYTLPDKVNVISEETVTIKTKVTGIMMHPEAVENSDFTSALAYTSFDYFEEMLNSLIDSNYSSEVRSVIPLDEYKKIAVNQILIKGSDPTKVLEEVDNYYASKEVNNCIISLTRDNLSSNISVQEDIVQARKMTYVFPTIFFIVSVLVILTTLSQIIVRERGLIGLMKALGIEKNAIIRHYISYGVVLCLIGGVLGVIVGPLLLPQVMNMKYNLLWELPNVKQDFFHIEYLVCILVLIILGAVVSYFVCSSEAKLKPVESMRPAPVKELKNSKFTSDENKKIDIPSKMALRNILLNKSRTLMVILGTMGCTALLVCGFGITDTLHYGVDKELYELFPYDIIVSYQTGQASPKEELLEVDGISHIEEVAIYPIKVTSTTTKETTIRLIDGVSTIFKEDYYSDGVAITKELADDLGLKKGDNVNFTINGVQFIKKIGAIFEASTSSGIFDLFENYKDSDLKVNSAWLLVDDDYQNETVKDEILKFDSIQTANTARDVEERANDLMSNINVMTATLKVFAILLAFVVIYNLATLNIKERSRSIATMKVLGFSRKEISNTLILEIMIMTFIGSLFGLLLGYPMMVLVLSINKTKLITFLYHINFVSYLYAFLLSAIVGLVINYFLSKKAYKIEMVEALKSVE